MVPVDEFQNAPPSLAARFAVAVPPLMETAPGPVRWMAPPFPGAPPVELAVKSVSVTVVVPASASMPPPARTAVLPENVEPLMVVAPRLLNTPPPEPAAPVAALSAMTESVTARVPPPVASIVGCTKMPPPPLAAVAPAATLPRISAPATVMVPPDEFQSPPPSLAAVLRNTSVPVTSTSPGPVRCSPPPLPGAAPVSFSTRLPPVMVVVPPSASMPPPARTAVLPVMVVSAMVTEPRLLKTPPPEPAAPVAAFSWIELPVMVTVPPVVASIEGWLKTPPPPFAASGPAAVLRSISVPVMVIVPAEEFQRPPPSLAASLALTNESVIVTVPAPVRCRPPPLPGVGPVMLPSSVVATSVVEEPALASMAPPARLALLPRSCTSVASKVPAFSTAPPLAVGTSTAVPPVIPTWSRRRVAPAATSKARSPRAEASIRATPGDVMVISLVTSRSPVAAAPSAAPGMVST